MNNTLPINFQGTFSYLNQTPPSGLDIDDCKENPCNNGGTCEDGIATYTCVCPIGFTGLSCETSKIR